MFTLLRTTPGCRVSVSIEDPVHIQVLFVDFHVAGQESLFFSNSQHSSSALEGCFFPQFLHTGALLYFFLFSLCFFFFSSPVSFGVGVLFSFNRSIISFIALVVVLMRKYARAEGVTLPPSEELCPSGGSNSPAAGARNLTQFGEKGKNVSET